MPSLSFEDIRQDVLTAINDAHKVAYEVFTFSTDIHSAVGVAEAVGLAPNTVVVRVLAAAA